MNYREEDREAAFSAWDLAVDDPPAADTPPRASLPPEKPSPPALVPVPAPGFPENLAYLPPLKRALVLAEIFGPPKGISQTVI